MSPSMLVKICAGDAILTRYVPQLAQTVVLETADAVALLALVAGLEETEHERADDHVAGDQREQAQVAEQVREELARAPAETRLGVRAADGRRHRCVPRRHHHHQQPPRRRRRRAPTTTALGPRDTK